ncbi:MAG: methyltransferase [Marinobacter sp.]|uniref:methyltransferase n=1 Tax=Marinobacter sp. TaxID=50741 RepID=UPI00299E07E0|nr:methyltransferase [Marinobacter sp.]MDX1633777.1 methyltransferase [Marinobacter sp.]
MTLAERFHQLDRFLGNHRAFWQIQPFHYRQMPWTGELADLSDWLEGLDDAQLDRLTQDPAALASALGPWLPQACEGLSLTDFAPLSAADFRWDARWSYQIPGRKWDQILAFARHVPTVEHPMLEWCAGKGHLGRLLAQVRGQPVTGLEIDPALCQAGDALASRFDSQTRLVPQDVLAQDAREHLGPDTHAVALHACGDLHGRLLELVCANRVPALSLSPCCYHRTSAPQYVAFSRAASRSVLALSRQDLALAVQETVTAGRRVSRLRDIEIAWRLGFDELQRELRGKDEYLPVPSFAKVLLSGDFSGFCAWAAAAKGMELPPDPPHQEFEQIGYRRAARTRRMELVIQLFRRPLETWLVLDRALYLQEQGYQVEVGSFCPRALTPRNLMIRAVRQPAAGDLEAKDQEG